jgi:hypothetical protein
MQFEEVVAGRMVYGDEALVLSVISDNDNQIIVSDLGFDVDEFAGTVWFRFNDLRPTDQATTCALNAEDLTHSFRHIQDHGWSALNLEEMREIGEPDGHDPEPMGFGL